MRISKGLRARNGLTKSVSGVSHRGVKSPSGRWSVQLRLADSRGKRPNAKRSSHNTDFRVPTTS
ncbi:MAG: hypothetical protein CO108_18445 [Deltaproteobacteria bacterium CG_4_9_14_3_um_filter_63_12]|nr:MAG: hypothetical protein CO108_18445 [Deltaproteobacteria bacterium CG_4_9_14_3_um_filter_63_12]